MQLRYLAEFLTGLCRLNEYLHRYQFPVASQNIVERQGITGLGFLFKIGDASFRGILECPLINIKLSEYELKQAGFTRTIRANQTDFAAFMYREGRVSKQQVCTASQ
jgi:hypothetical protein